MGRDWSEGQGYLRITAGSLAGEIRVTWVSFLEMGRLGIGKGDGRKRDSSSFSEVGLMGGLSMV